MEAIETNIPEAVAKEAILHGVSLLEREDDFLATSDKLIGQEFEAATARSALNRILEALGVSADNVVPFSSPSPQEEVDMPARKNEGDVAELERSENDRTKYTKPVGKAVEPDKEEAGAPLIANEPEVKQPKSKSKLKVKAPEVKVEPIKEEAKPKSKLKVKAFAAAPKVEEPKEEVKPAPKNKRKTATIVDLAEAKKKVDEKQKEKQVKVEAKKAAASKSDPKISNGNGRERGKRWFIKEMVLENPTMGAEDILNALTEARPGFTSSVPSVSSIRLDFMATVRAAKSLDKLKASIAKKIPEPKTQRNATALLAAVNMVVIEEPTLSVDEVVAKVKDKGFKGFTPSSVSASRAAIIESMHVLKEMKALK